MQYQLLRNLQIPTLFAMATGILFCLAHTGFSTEFFETPSSNSVQLKNHKITLHNLNPNVNKWFIIEIEGSQKLMLHFDNTDSRMEVDITKSGLAFSAEGKSIGPECLLWNNHQFNLLSYKNRQSKSPYQRLCDGRIHLRHKKSSKTKLSTVEWATELLRKNKYGESIINAFKPFLVSLHVEEGEALKPHAPAGPANADGPMPATTKHKMGSEPFSTKNRLMMSVKNKEKYLRFGRFYETNWHEGVYVSVFMNNQLPKSTLKSFPTRVNRLGSEELTSLAYVVGYDLEKYTLNYSLGVDQPGIAPHSKNWHPKKNKLQKAIVSIGSVPPYILEESVGVFVGGFKRYHGRIKKGPLAGKTYGFIENGVELEPLSSKLATLSIHKNGYVDISEWPEDPIAQATKRKTTVSARQNGVMVIQNGEPTPFINQRYAGAWSGDVKGRLQTLRSAVCIQHKDNKRYLLFLALTAATPSALARTMQAYQCEDGFQLDMNAHVFVYNTIFRLNRHKKVKMQLLHEEMQWPRDANFHRFIVDNNKRDFFYIFNRNSPLFQGPNRSHISKKEVELK